MAYQMTKDLETYLADSLPEVLSLLEEICTIPSPSGQEDKRAQFIKTWLEKEGAKGVYIDRAKNVIFPVNCEGKDNITVFAAHSDTVFPMETPLPFTRDEKNLYCPGVGDDAMCLVMMLFVIRYILRKGITPKNPVLFVADSCEEGLGNLKGTRALFEDFEGRIERFYTFDGLYRDLVNHCVGSHRFIVTATAQGGHSFASFGNTNAIAALSALITDLYTIKVPEKEGTKTTYNVGTIEGGTTVNSIAQKAKMLCEYRSDDAQCLAIMEEAFKEKFEKAKKMENVSFDVEIVGIRPCGAPRDKEALLEMTNRAKEVCEKESGVPCTIKSGSTDCNIPASLGIPALCVGTFDGGGEHTLEEWVVTDSIPKGLKITATIILDYFNA